MEPMTQILLAVRVGDESAGPGRTAAWLASRLGARVTVLYVATELRTVPEIGVAAGLAPGEVRARMIEDARERAVAWGRAALGEAPFDVRVEDGVVAERVGAVAAELGVDLVVAGTEARGGIRGMILGDTTREILRHSPCPVVVVPPGVAGG